MSCEYVFRIQHPGLAREDHERSRGRGLDPGGRRRRHERVYRLGPSRAGAAGAGPRIEAEHAARASPGECVRQASTAPSWTARWPGRRHAPAPAFQSDPLCSNKINAGELHYLDIHLSHVAQQAWFGFLGHMDVAVMECWAYCPTGA